MRFLFLFLILPKILLAEFKGLDVLGLAMQDCKMIERVIPNNTAIGVLDGTFGDPKPCLEQLIRSNKVSAVRVHLINGACARNRNCENDEPRPDDEKVITERALSYSEILNKHKIPCFISPILEHDLRDKKLLQRIFNAVKRTAPNCYLVQSAYSGVRLPKILNEYHGNYAIGDITSNDGETIFENLPSSYPDSGKIITFAWFHSLNLRARREDKFIPPKERTLRASEEEIVKALQLIKKDS